MFNSHFFGDLSHERELTRHVYAFSVDVDPAEQAERPWFIGSRMIVLLQTNKHLIWKSDQCAAIWLGKCYFGPRTQTNRMNEWLDKWQVGMVGCCSLFKSTVKIFDIYTEESDYIQSTKGEDHHLPSERGTFGTADTPPIPTLSPFHPSILSLHQI